MIEENKALVRRFIETIYNEGDFDAIADFFIPGSFLAGGFASQMKVMKTAFPDNIFKIEEMVAEGDKVVVQMTARGTNTGPLAGLPAFGKLEKPLSPSGKPVMTSSISVFTIKDGRIASIATELDQIGMLQQMGWTITPPNPT